MAILLRKFSPEWGNEKMEKAEGLIVGDEAINAKDIHIHNQLKDLNYAPAVAPSGEQAIKQADAIKPEQVLMDILLKGIYGIETAELIRDRFDIPVIYFTADLDEERLEKTKVTGPFCYILAADSELRSTIEVALQRHKREKALRKDEERFRALTENTSDWIWEVDENAVYTYSSPKIKELLGYEPEEIIGKTLFDLMTPEDAKRVATEFGVIAEAHKPFDRLEKGNLHKDGQILVLETSGVPIFDANGNFRGYCGIDRDITERKKREEELKTQREQIKLINKILRHDIINDLNVINSALGLYGRSKEEGLLEEASAHVNKSVELINRMRELESFISSHSDLKLYSVTDVCKKVLASHPAIAFNIEGEGQVMADESLSSLIDNIIRNAVVHGKTDRIDIKIEGRGDYREIRIGDYGVGIPDEIKEQIFEESFAYGETGGTGLGLHIVKKAMETYGGHVHVEDNTPGGAVFVLALRKVR